MATNWGTLKSKNCTFTLTLASEGAGRHPANSILLNHPSVSKFQAVLEEGGPGSATVVDQGSLNGTYVDGKRVESGKPKEISNGARIRFGYDPEEFTFVSASKAGNFHEKTIDGGIELNEDDILKEHPKLGLGIEEGVRQALFRLEKEGEELKTEISKNEAMMNEEEKKLLDMKSKLEDKMKEHRMSGTKKEALEKYIIEMQRRFTDLERTNETKQEQIEELCDKDWARNLETIKLEQKHLDRIINEKSAELQNIQKFASNLLNGGTGSPNVQILEEQSKELSIIKRQLLSYQNRNNECQRKWKDLYDENARKDDHIKGLRLQLDRQSDLYQQLYTEFDRKYYDAQNIVASIVRSPLTSDTIEKASEFLVNQVKTIQEETEDFNVENEDLRKNYDDLNIEVERLLGQKAYYSSAFEAKHPGEPTHSLQAIHSIKTRIYELMDLAEELKLFSTAQEKVDLQNLIRFLEDKLKKTKNRNNMIAGKIENISKFMSGDKEENTVDFFARLLEDKEKKMNALAAELESQTLRTRNNQQEIEELNSKLQGLTGMCFDMEDAQKKINDIVFTKRDNQDTVLLKNEVITSNNVFTDQHHLNENPALKSFYS